MRVSIPFYRMAVLGIQMVGPMARGRLLHPLNGFLLIALLLTGCADEYIVLHSLTGEPLVISRRSYTSDGCLEKMKEDASRLGVAFRYVHVRGTTVGRSLLWPFEPGYACEAAIGPEQRPSGTFPINAHSLSQGS